VYSYKQYNIILVKCGFDKHSFWSTPSANWMVQWNYCGSFPVVRSSSECKIGNDKKTQRLFEHDMDKIYPKYFI